MKENYFVVNGKKYYTGTVFIVENMGKQVEASFICNDVEHSRYVYKIKDCIWRVTPEHFQQSFISVTDKIDDKVHMPVTKTKKDMEIDGLFLGWLWYIFLMAVATIFKGNIGLWILISIVFFSWRAKKIKEEGTYIEW